MIVLKQIIEEIIIWKVLKTEVYKTRHLCQWPEVTKCQQTSCLPKLFSPVPALIYNEAVPIIICAADIRIRMDHK